MKKANEIIEKGVTTFNAVNSTLEKDKITSVKHIVEPLSERVELWYNKCISPMMLSYEQYQELEKGKPIELHKGEIFIQLKIEGIIENK